MLITIRQATSTDAPILAAATRQIAATPGFFVSQPSELSDQKFVELIQALQNSYFVAEHNGVIVGHGFLEPLHLNAISHVVHLTLVIHQGWQGKGIGKQLLEHLIQWAKESQHIRKIELHVRASNARAISLYRKMGFEQEGCLKQRVKISDDLYVDDVLMALFVKM